MDRNWKDFKSEVVPFILKQLELLKIECAPGCTKTCDFKMEDLRFSLKENIDMVRDVKVTMREYTKGDEKGRKLTLEIEHIHGCFEDVTFSYHCFGDESKTEDKGRMTVCFREGNGNGMKLKMSWCVPYNAQKPQGHQHEGPSDVQITRGIEHFTVLPPSSVQTTGHEGRVPGEGVARKEPYLQSVKCAIDQALDITFDVKQGIVDEVGAKIFESEIKRSLCCFVAGKLRQELDQVQDKVVPMVQRAHSDLLIPKSGQPHGVKPCARWTHVWLRAETEGDEKIALAQQKFQEVFVPVARRH